MAPLFNYPDSFGSHKASVFPHTGPVLYTPMTDTPLAGGDVVEAVEAGLHNLEYVSAGISDSGTYFVQAAPPPSSPSTNRNAISGTTYHLRWVVLATGAEAGAIDLSGETVRLFALGRY